MYVLSIVICPFVLFLLAIVLSGLLQYTVSDYLPLVSSNSYTFQGRIQDFKLGGARKFLGYFVWKITILRQKIIFCSIAEGGAKIFEVFRVKNHDLHQKIIFFSNFRGGGAHPASAPTLNPPLHLYLSHCILWDWKKDICCCICAHLYEIHILIQVWL